MSATEKLTGFIGAHYRVEPLNLSGVIYGRVKNVLLAPNGVAELQLEEVHLFDARNKQDARWVRGDEIDQGYGKETSVFISEHQIIEVTDNLVRLLLANVGIPIDAIIRKM